MWRPNVSNEVVSLLKSTHSQKANNCLSFFLLNTRFLVSTIRVVFQWYFRANFLNKSPH